MNEYRVTIHYTDKDGVEHTFISEKVADTEAEAVERATAIFKHFCNPTDIVSNVCVEVM